MQKINAAESLITGFIAKITLITGFIAKNIAMAKQIYDEEQQQLQQTVKPGNKRKRIEVSPWQVGRPTTTETLIKIDGEDDMEMLQLSSRELILRGTTANRWKKPLTKCKTNIVVNTNKQYLT